MTKLEWLVHRILSFTVRTRDARNDDIHYALCGARSSSPQLNARFSLASQTAFSRLIKRKKMLAYRKISHVRGQSSNATFLLLLPCMESL